MPKRFLKFSDRWMFNRVLCEKEVCRKVLRAALGIEVGEITYLNAEQAKEPAAASRGVRMDVFAREGSRVFDIEMQVSPEDRIGRRMRYYQAAIDATELGPGEDYGLLPESFVVFFCATDPFRAGEAVYSIERVCLEAPELVAGDDSHWRVFNASAAEDVADPDLRDLLHYVATGRPDGALSREIDSLVEEYNRDREWVTKVLTYEQVLPPMYFPPFTPMIHNRSRQPAPAGYANVFPPLSAPPSNLSRNARASRARALSEPG